MRPLTTGGGVFDLATRNIINSNLLLAGLGPTQGNVYWVLPHTGYDGNDGLSPGAAKRTLAAALAACAAGQNDIVLLCSQSNTAGNTTDYQSAKLDWNKFGVHLIGVNAGSFLGQRSRISNLSTAASFANLFEVSASGCIIAGIEFFQGAGSDTFSGAQTCVKVSGQRNHFINCQISGNGDLAGTTDQVGTNSLTITGSENTFDDCYIGLDTVIRATSLTEVVLSGSPTRNLFRKCHFETYTSASTFKMITIPTTMDRWTKFTDCDFVAVQNITSAVAPTGVIGITTCNGQVIVRNPLMYGFAQYVTADNAYVQMLGLVGTATSHLVGITQGVDAT